MSGEQHHHDALVETARSELERAHAAAVAMNAAELRRGLELALAAVREAGTLPGPVDAMERALAELDSGRLADMERHVEQARGELRG